MELAQLAAGLAGAAIAGDPGLAVDKLANHTRDVEPGTLFFCIAGLKADGHDYAAQAVADGAVALVCERHLELGVPQVVAPSARRALAFMAARFLGEPSRELRVVAVTGTNGKTTTAHIMADILAAAGLRPALLGTVCNRIGGREVPVRLTTAESLELQGMFRNMVDAGDLSCAMEASSHALALHRTDAIDFDAVAFTNLTRDHLDFHADLDEYFLCKRRLFLPEGERQPHAVAIVNVADERGRQLAEDCRPLYGEDLWTFAVADAPDGSPSPSADAQATGLRLGVESSRFTLTVPRLSVQRDVELHVAARFNVENALTAATSMLALGLPVEAVVDGLAKTEGVPGRFEPVRAGQPFTVVVDYSHTPDSLQNALLAARDIATGRVLVVFGCGGDRDRGKRPLMGSIGARLADLVFVTSDNPRTEDPLAIIDEIVAGVPTEHGRRLVAEPDRRAAIALCLAEAQAGDVVLIAGKGHEQGQLIGDRRIPFDDRAVARELLQGWRGAEE
jgi:UDP-N-acetylmuramoyl-L-alanyl-D-glutamate--2,6-diaminopimelate ligase